MKKLLVVVFALASAVPCLAQTAQPPKPGPEVRKLAFYLGTWKFEGEQKIPVFGPVGKYSYTDTCEWFTGGFHMICRVELTGPAGKMTMLEVLGYDSAAKTYTYLGITSLGSSDAAKGSLTGNTWTWLWDGKAGSKPARFREIVEQVSPTSYTVKLEHSVAGGPWTVVEEGAGTKVK